MFQLLNPTWLGSPNPQRFLPRSAAGWFRATNNSGGKGRDGGVRGSMMWGHFWWTNQYLLLFFDHLWYSVWIQILIVMDDIQGSVPVFVILWYSLCNELMSISIGLFSERMHRGSHSPPPIPAPWFHWTPLNDTWMDRVSYSRVDTAGRLLSTVLVCFKHGHVFMFIPFFFWGGADVLTQKMWFLLAWGNDPAWLIFFRWIETNSQWLTVTWWFGFLGSPFWKRLLLRSIPIRVPNHRDPNHQFTITLPETNS